MKPQQYLQDKLKNCTSYEITDADKKLAKENIEEYIYSKLTSKNFRRWKIDADSEKQVRKAIGANVSQNKPIQFTFPFGGYKLHHMPTSPEVDWAEFMTIAYYCSYVSSILPAYKPGVEFYFSSDDVIIERMDNVPKEDTQAYVDSFCKLISYFQKHFPINMRMSLKRVCDFYKGDEEVFEKELSENLMKEEYVKVGDNDFMQKLSRLNIQWDGKDHWDKLSQDEKEKKIKQGAIYHHAYCNVSRRRLFVRGEDKIVLFASPIPNAIAIGTTKTSITKFWTGIGVLEKVGNSYRDRILSPSQWEKAKDDKHEEAEINLIDMNNFKKVLVYPPFNFTV